LSYCWLRAEKGAWEYYAILASGGDESQINGGCERSGRWARVNSTDGENGIYFQLPNRTGRNAKLSNEAENGFSGTEATDQVMVWDNLGFHTLPPDNTSAVIILLLRIKEGIPSFWEKM